MKENKTARVELRLTPKEKERIKEYAEQHHMTISEVIRVFCYKIFYGVKED